MREPQPWIIEQIVEMLQKDNSFENQEEEIPNLLAIVMKNELMDLMENEYFQTALYESLEGGFQNQILDEIENIYRIEESADGSI